ncbi:MAG: FkbM family methyltransferase [Acidimicrobiia bacterium]
MEIVKNLPERLRARRAPRVQGGPGRGLRIGRAEASADYRAGTNELAVQTALADVLRPGMDFLDVGANVGFFTMLAARIVGPAGRAVAIEPVPANVAQVRANARRNRLSNVEVLEMAAGDAVGTTTLVLAAHPGGAAIASAGDPPDATGTIDVEVTTVDALVAAGRIPAPAVVKVDVEGAEAAVLRGMAATLAEHRPVVLVEIDHGDRDGLSAKRVENVALLEAAGYQIRWLDPSYDEADWLVEHFVATPAEVAP